MAQVGEEKPNTKPPVKPPTKPPVKPGTTPSQPSKPQSQPRQRSKPYRTIMNVKPTGLTPRMATKIVGDQYNGNVQGAWHDYAPGAIKEYMNQGLPFAQARAQAQEDFGFDIYDPLANKGPKLYANYGWNPDYSEEPKTYGPYEPEPRRGGGGGGGYSIPTPPIPEMKIRTTSGIRRSPYWQSDDPYNSGTFEPRFVVLGNNSAW